MKTVLRQILLHKEWVVFFIPIFIFLLLIFKDPFSERTLIPNFEPFPDALFYLIRPINLVKGNGFFVAREGRVTQNTTPPLYSFTFIPFLLINSDPRMVYFANIFLSLISAGLFFLILKRITTNIWVISFVFFLYTTNYFLYWMPTLAMAENLILPLYLISILLLTGKSSYANFTILGALSVCIYATKGANAPITAMILIISIFKIFKLQIKTSLKLKSSLYLFFGFFSFFSLYALFLYYIIGSNIILSVFGYLGLTSQVMMPTGDETGVVSVSSSARWASFDYIKTNLPLYLSSLQGNPQRFLWDNTPLLPKYIAYLSITGLLVGVFVKRCSFLSITLLLMVTSSVGFLLTFYAFDARYIYIAIPSLMLGFAILMASALRRLERIKYQKIIFFVLLGLFFGFYFATNAIRIKSQISLNLRYA